MTTITLNGTMTLGELLALYRQLGGLDQTQMGEALGASRPTISAWERDLREPSFSQVVTWARLTGQPLAPLVEAVNAKTAPTEVEAVEDVVRPKGLEPLTF